MTAATTITLTPDELAKIVRVELEAYAAKNSPPKLLSPDELARWLGVEKETVHTYVSRDGLPCVRLGPKLLRFELQAVMQWARGRGRNLPSLPEASQPRHLRAMRGAHG